MHYPIIALIMGHRAWAPEGREGRYRAGPKGRNQEVGAGGPLDF